LRRLEQLQKTEGKFEPVWIKRLAFSTTLTEKGIPPEEPLEGISLFKGFTVTREAPPFITPLLLELPGLLGAILASFCSRVSDRHVSDEASAEQENKGHKQSKPFRSSLYKFPINLFKFFSLIALAQFLPLSCSYLKHVEIRAELGLFCLRFFMDEFGFVYGKKTCLFLFFRYTLQRKILNRRRGMTMLLRLLHAAPTSVQGRQGRQMMLHSWD